MREHLFLISIFWHLLRLVSWPCIWSIFVKVPECLKRFYILQLLGSINNNYVKVVQIYICRFWPIYSINYSERDVKISNYDCGGVLFSFSFVLFFMSFEATLLGTYTFVIMSFDILSLYHSKMCLFISGNTPCFKVYFVHYENINPN